MTTEREMPASEFGGKAKTNGVQPAPHVPDASERLMLLYTGGEGGRTDHLAFTGLIPLERQIALRQAEGALDKGQVWEELVAKGEPLAAAAEAEVVPE